MTRSLQSPAALDAAHHRDLLFAEAERHRLVRSARVPRTRPLRLLLLRWARRRRSLPDFRRYPVPR